MFGFSSKFCIITIQRSYYSERLFSIRVLVTSDDSGLIETVKNSISIHSIKKEAYTRKWNEEGAVFSLKDYYTRVSVTEFNVKKKSTNPHSALGIT